LPDTKHVVVGVQRHVNGGACAVAPDPWLGSIIPNILRLEINRDRTICVLAIGDIGDIKSNIIGY
jgi:hypothetical protein